jgi:hypothetical protein
MAMSYGEKVEWGYVDVPTPEEEAADMDAQSEQLNADSRYEEECRATAAAESRGEARGRAAVLVLVDRLEQLAAQMDREAQHPKCSHDRMLYTEGNAKGLRYAVEQLRAHAAGVAAPDLT